MFVQGVRNHQPLQIFKLQCWVKKTIISIPHLIFLNIWCWPIIFYDELNIVDNFFTPIMARAEMTLAVRYRLSTIILDP